MRKDMKKKDLRTGMRVTTECGRKGVIALGHDYGDIIILEHRSYLSLQSYDDNMVYGEGGDYSIVKVEKVVDNMELFTTSPRLSKLYEVEKAKEMTVAELEAQLGYKIKVVK